METRWINFSCFRALGEKGVFADEKGGVRRNGYPWVCPSYSPSLSLLSPMPNHSSKRLAGQTDCSQEKSRLAHVFGFK